MGLTDSFYTPPGGADTIVMGWRVGSVVLIRVITTLEEHRGWIPVQVVGREAFHVQVRLPSGKLLALDLDELRSWRSPVVYQFDQGALSCSKNEGSSPNKTHPMKFSTKYNQAMI